MSDELDGNRLIETMCAAYRSFDWYQDSGYVLTVFEREGGGEFTTQRKFKTHYCRPNKFRFEWTESCAEGVSDAYAVWSDGKRAYKKYGNGDVEIVRSDDSGVRADLELAIAGATGISGGAAHDVMSLLFGFEGNMMAALKEVRYLGDETQNGELCHCVRAALDTNFQLKLWISASRNILLKKREHYNLAEVPRLDENLEGLSGNLQGRSMDAELDGSGAGSKVRKVIVYQSVELNTPFRLDAFSR